MKKTFFLLLTVLWVSTINAQTTSFFTVTHDTDTLTMYLSDERVILLDNFNQMIEYKITKGIMGDAIFETSEYLILYKEYPSPSFVFLDKYGEEDPFVLVLVPSRTDSVSEVLIPLRT